MPTTMDDPQLDVYLVRRAKEGYLDAFEELVRRHQTRGYALALRMLGDRHEAQDVLQDAFMDAWRGLGRFEGTSAFGTWFYRIVVNRCLMQQRKRRASPVADVPDRASGSRPDVIVEEKKRDEALHNAIQQLPGDLRAPLVMVTFSGFSYEEAAAVLGTTASTVRGRVARARKALLQNMKGWA